MPLHCFFLSLDFLLLGFGKKKKIKSSFGRYFVVVRVLHDRWKLMASACVNIVGMSPDNFLDCPPAKCPSYAWLSPRIPLISDEEVGKTCEKHRQVAENADDSEKQEDSDPDVSGVDFVDFEFRLEDPVAMLPADELFADGKLVPLQLSATRQPMITIAPRAASDIILPDTPVFRRRNEISPADPFLFSPKAPRCSSRWKELLGLRKLYQNSMAAKQEDGSLTASNIPTNRNAAKSLKHFLHRSTKPSANAAADSSLNIPLLKEMDNESVSISSRISLSSSSSSGHEHDDLPRLSLDSDKPRAAAAITRNTRQPTRNISRVRVVKTKGSLSENPTTTRVSRNVARRAPESTVTVGGVAVDSPRMNSSGKIVFHSLERSSSSPSSFNGGSRYKHRGMERSYSANVRVTPVLNVPVCSSLRGSSKSGHVFGFPMFSSQPKKLETCTSCNGGAKKIHRTERT
ncbi:uncharacterized protein [Henckelia pumila]|uniref:uncharacterized protein n=1 Tax=Henckelia pumila TaxID=405737 RepID=UPI003C6E596F